MAEFPYDRASQILAYGKLFSRKAALELYDVKPSTYDSWKNKLKKDQALIDLTQEAFINLKEEWKEESVFSLKLALRTANKAFTNHPFDKKPETIKEKIAWAKSLTAVALAIKNIGELTIGTVVLQEDDTEEDEQD